MSGFFRVLGTILVWVLIFTAGFFFGAREEANKNPQSVNITQSNGSNINLLRELKRFPVEGVVNETSTGVFGEMFAYSFESTEAETTTEILFSLRSVPLSIGADSNTLEIPSQLEVYSAFLNEDGTDFVYTKLGTINLDTPDQNNTRRGDFAVNLDYSIFDEFRLQRFVFEIPDQQQSNIFVIDDPDLPLQVQSQPAPIFWVDV